MSVCTFFGHRDCYGLDVKKLYREIEKLIEQGVDTFYVGDQGQFDGSVRAVLRQLQGKFPHIRYAVVLATLPTGSPGDDTMYPEGLENTPPKFAIDRRNRWLVDRADFVICYIRHSWGGAYKFAHLASRKGKHIINLSDVSIEF